jgi:phosphatidylcholine synthase
VDGTLARAVRVTEIAPRIDGEVLDLVVDYLNYVFVPALFMLEAGMLPRPVAFPLAALILLSSLYVSARRDMKTGDGYFRGFPALWNVVLLYLYAGQIGQLASAATVASFALLSFAPIHVVHPLRVRDYGRALPIIAMTWLASTVGLLLVPSGAQNLWLGLFSLSTLSALALILLGLTRTYRGELHQ